MNTYTIIAGVNGTGKSSLRGVLEGQGVTLGRVIDPDYIAKKHNYNMIMAGKQAIKEINDCLSMNVSFTQETTLAGKRIEKTIIQARKQGYYIIMYYIGLNSMEESLYRIENRVRKGGHNIPKEDVIRRFDNRYSSIKDVLCYCDEVHFYDNENGFVKVAEIKNNVFRYFSDYKPIWITELQQEINL